MAAPIFLRKTVLRNLCDAENRKGAKSKNRIEPNIEHVHNVRFAPILARKNASVRLAGSTHKTVERLAYGKVWLPQTDHAFALRLLPFRSMARNRAYSLFCSSVG